ncbi:MAG: hypothetical protein LUC98_04175 [Lachnospiraceae bacterium]|nr:hypothetical protein [Lachnospiraceae bacterium]
MKKKLLGMFSVICMMVCMMGSTVFAASDITTIESRLAQISSSSGYTVGSSKASNYCYGFVNDVSKLLFGVSIPSSVSGYKLTYMGDYWYQVGSIRGGSSDADSSIRQLLESAQAGDVIQFRSSYTNPKHTAMIYSVDTAAGTIKIYDSARKSESDSSQQVRIKEYSLNSVVGKSGIGSFTGSTSYGLSLYRCTHDVSTSAISSASSNTGTTSVPVSASVTTVSAESISETGATLYGSWSVSGTRPSECGILLGTSTDSMTKLGSDTIRNYSGSMWYSTSKYGRTLQAGTSYYYQAYVVVSGQTYKGEIKSFVTPVSFSTGSNTSSGSTSTVSNTRTGVVRNTAGYLAINSSPSSRSRIGVIPEGASVTVYPDKQSGNWYWVEYNGVSGYSYSKYITLQ